MTLATQVRSKPASKASVTRHPLFPAMVALWFGALFGLGSLAVRASLLESFVLSLSLDVLLPAAAPPLGLKARLILALLMAAIGVAAGAILARRIARPKPVETPRKRGIGSRIGGRQFRAEPVAEPEQIATRRRPLTTETEESAGHRYDAAPLPGGSPEIFDVTRMDFTPAPVETPDSYDAGLLDEADDAPLALDAFVVEERMQIAPTPCQSFAEPVVDECAAPQAERQVFGMARPEPESEFAAEFDADEPLPVEAPLDLLAADEVDDYAHMVEALRHVDSVPAIQDAPVLWSDEPPAGHEDEQSFVPDAPLPVVSAALFADPLPAQAESVVESKPVRRIETAELSELSPVELIERLAQAMRQRSQQGPLPEALVDAVTSLAAALPAAGPVDEITTEIAPEPVPQSFAAVPEVSPPPPMPLALPAALRPIDFADYADHDDGADMLLPPRSFAAPASMTPAETVSLVDEAEIETAEDDYSSLLELGRPGASRQDFVRIDEPEEDTAAVEPVVIFPGHGARPGLRFAAPAATDQDDQTVGAGDLADQDDEVAGAAEATDAGIPQFRRFDAPSATASPAPAPLAGGIRQDPEEAQRALRSALATLQRMSGAA